MAQDPYAPIRTLPRNWFERLSRGSQMQLTGNSGSGSGDGSNDVWTDVPYEPTYGLTPEGFTGFEGLGGFQSKFGDISDLGENRIGVKYQDPGKHKYDLLNAIYSRPDANSDWMMEGGPSETRQASTFETFYKDPFEQFGKDFVLPAAAMYLGGSALTGTGLFAGAGTGSAAAGAAEAGIGTLGTIAPGSSALAPLATTGLASTAPAITATIPQIGGLLAAGGGVGTLGTIASGSEALAPLATTGQVSTAPAITATIPQVGAAAGGLFGGSQLGQMANGLLDYAKTNPQVVGGLLGALTGATGGMGSSGGGDAPYTGPMPTISRGNWQPRAQAQMMALPQFQAPQVTQGAQGSGLWRFLGGK